MSASEQEQAGGFGGIIGLGLLLGSLVIAPGLCFMFYGYSKWYINKRLVSYGEKQNGIIQSKRRINVGDDGSDEYVWKFRYKYDFKDDDGNDQTIFGSIQDKDKNKYDIGDFVELIMDPKYKYIQKPVKYASNLSSGNGCCSGMLYLSVGLSIFMPTVIPCLISGYFLMTSIALFVGIICAFPCCKYRVKKVKQSKLDWPF